MRFEPEMLRRQIGDAFSDDPMLRPLMQFVSFAERANPTELRLITINQLAHVSGLAPEDGAVFRLASILTSASLPLLKLNFLYVNGINEYPVSDEEIKEARETGFLVDPDSGDAVVDYEKHLLPFFSASDEFREFRSEH